MNVVHDYQIEKGVLGLHGSGCPPRPSPSSGRDKSSPDPIGSTNLDSWSPDQLKMMYFGGNNRAQVFLKQHGWTDGGKIEAKYTSRAAELYKQLLSKEVAKSKAEESKEEDAGLPASPDETPEISASPKASQSAFTTSIKKPIVAKKSGKPGGLGARKLTKKLRSYQVKVCTTRSLKNCLFKFLPPTPQVISPTGGSSSFTSRFEYTDNVQPSEISSGCVLNHVSPPMSPNLFADYGMDSSFIKKNSKSSKVQIEETDEARNKFSNAKAISSAQFFGDQRKAEMEASVSLQKFSGSSVISSADLFGNDNRSDLHLSASDLINRISFQAQQDMSSRKNIAGETGKRLGSFASTLIADFQDRILKEQRGSEKEKFLPWHQQFISLGRSCEGSDQGDFASKWPDIQAINHCLYQRLRGNGDQKKISAESWGKEDFGAVYEGTMSNGIKIAVKRLDGLGHVIESFQTEVKIVCGIHHVNLLIETEKRKIETRMRGTRGYLAPEWLNSVITEKVYVYAFGIVLLEVLCGRKNLDPSQAYEDVHLLTVFERKVDQQQLMDMVDKNNEEMQMHKEIVTEMMSIAAWCLQGDFTKRTSISLVVKALEGLYYIESNPPKYYYASSSPDSIHFSFDGQTLTALQESRTSPAQFIKLQPDGHYGYTNGMRKHLNWKSYLIFPFHMEGTVGIQLSVEEMAVVLVTGDVVAPQRKISSCHQMRGKRKKKYRMFTGDIH
ncbi:putative ADP-ribosylation factor GTPase-activating protein AGD8 [Capsicum annuum]|nr:putative ADP-ribosylation factor GTPase-activating protein AGD8 [Capsicum annuum]